MRIATLLAFLIVLPLAAMSSQDEKAALRAKVHELLRQMETNGDVAEWELLRLGPDALPFLPPTATAPGSIKARLTSLVATLEELRPRTWTEPSATVSLAEALKRLAKQTGLDLVDRRHGGSDNPVTLDFQSVTYWQAVAALAKQTHAGVSLYQQDGQVALVDSRESPPQSLHGPFRVVVKRIGVVADLGTGTHICNISLEIAWEPRFSPYLLEAGAARVVASKGYVAKIPSRGSVQIVERNAKDFDMQFAAPPRSVAKIDELAGQCVVTMPATTHLFKKLKEKEPQIEGGITATVNAIAVNKDRWQVEMTIEHPAAGPTFESFQVWLGNKAWLDATQCFFERGAGELREVLRPDALRTQVVASTGRRVTVRYHFSAKDAKGTPPTQWRLMLRTPGRMIEMTVPYQFKDLRLP